MNNRHWRIVFALANLILAPCARADDALPPIREFDIPTVERLGREMYEQDQLAWKATDILFTKHSKDELRAQKQHGWIVDSFPDHEVVRFVRDTDLGPMLAYDVTFTAGQPLTYSEPQSALLNGDELAQYNARTLAIHSVDRPCAQTYNSVALKDPQGDGWLVWAMAATTKPDEVIVGGHYRFTISKDGKSIIRKDALSRGCLVLPKPQPKKDETYLGVFVSHLVSLTPIETYVFDSLSYDKPFHIGTLDGRAWTIERGKVTELSDDMPDPQGFAARALAGVSETCNPMLTKTVDGKDQTSTGGNLKVIEATENADYFKPKVELPEGTKITAIFCARQSLVPSPNDYKVLLGGFPFYIADRGQGHPKRLGVLYSPNGKFSFKLVEGDSLTPELQAKIDARLDAMQAIARTSKAK